MVVNLEYEKLKRKLDNIAEGKYFEAIKRNGMPFSKFELAIYKTGFFTAMTMIQRGELIYKKEQEKSETIVAKEWKGKEFDIPKMEGVENE